MISWNYSNYLLLVWLYIVGYFFFFLWIGIVYLILGSHDKFFFYRQNNIYIYIYVYIYIDNKKHKQCKYKWLHWPVHGMQRTTSLPLRLERKHYPTNDCALHLNLHKNKYTKEDARLTITHNILPPSST